MARTPYSDIQLPKWVVDPLYTSSQKELDVLGTDLLTGNIPEYYKSIGEFNSPQFQAMLKSVTGDILQGSQESAAISGTGRSGIATSAANEQLSSIIPNLTYQDYLRAIQGRGALLDTGINVKSSVRGSAQTQGLNESNFNQMLFEDQIALINANEAYKGKKSGAVGNMIGTVAGLGLGALTGGLGLLPGVSGGLTGAIGGGLFGTGVGSSIASGNSASSIGSLLSGLSSLQSPSYKQGQSYGVSDPELGSFKSLKDFSSSNPDVNELLYGGFSK